MKCILSFIAAVAFSGITLAQSVTCPPPPSLHVIANGDTLWNNIDTVPCGVPCVTIYPAIDSYYLQGTTTYSVTSVGYAPQSFTGGTNVPYMGAPLAPYGGSDDLYGDLIPMPFSFCFFGVTYNNIVVGSNGNASFTAGNADMYDPWPISGPLPGSNCAATENCIMAPWIDLEPVNGGTITYAVYGSAPCRQFVISWNGDVLFTPGTCTGTNTQQIILYESTNIIDIYIANRTVCTAWNDGLAVTGIENPGGTTFYTPPGENGTTFTATNQGWRFTPATPPNWTYTWKDSTGAVIGTGDSIILCPTVTSRYSLDATNTVSCLTDLADNFTIVKENGFGINDTATVNPSYCHNDGSILFHGMATGDSVVITYTYNGVNVGPVVKYPDADSNILFSGLPGGTYADFMFQDKHCFFGPFTFTLTPHPMSAAITVNANAVCQGTPVQFTGQTVDFDQPTFTWNFGDGSAPVTGSIVSYTYPVGGFYTAVLTVRDTFNCDSTAIDTTDVITINVLTNTYDTSVCLVDSMPVFARAIVDLPFVGWNYSWTPINNIGLDSTYTSPGVLSSVSNTNFFGIGTFVYQVLATTTYPPLVLNPNGCSDTSTERIISYPPLKLNSVTASPQVIEFGSSIQLNANGAVYYTWAPDNGTLNNANVSDPVATPVDSVTVYTVYGMNNFGCRDSATVIVGLDYIAYPGAPGAFTPNGDGLNDYFKITQLKYQKLVEIRIFNRWGQEVFHTSNIEVGWDGKYNGVPQDIGAYGYEVIVALADGGNKVYKGTLTLLR